MVTSFHWVVGPNRFPGSRLQPALRSLWLAASAAMLIACGGGGSGGSATGFPPLPPDSPSSPPSQQPVGKGSVGIRVITTAGMPVSDVDVNLNGGFAGRSLKTDANGEALFEDVPAGDASMNLYASGYHQVYRRLSVAAGSQNRAVVTILRASDAVPVLLATYPATPSADGSRLTLEADIAILAADGSSRADLVADDFGFEGTCDWYPCVVDADGRNVNASYSAHVVAASFAAVPQAPFSSSAVGVLIEQSDKMGTFDPQGLRLQAVRDYFDRVLPPNVVTLASQRETGATPILTTYGGFTSDGGLFRSAIDELRGQEAGSSRTLGAITEMAGFMKAGLADVAGSPRPVMVVTAADEAGSGDCPDPNTCSQSLQSATDAAQAAGVKVIAAGPLYTPASDVAFRTGGALVATEHPSQWPVLFRALDSLAVGSLPYYRVRVELDAGAPLVFVPDRWVRGGLTIRVGADTRLFLWYLTIPI